MERHIKMSSLENADIVTHSGVFHSDDIMATAILEMKAERDGKVLNLCRIPTPQMASGLPNNVIVYDIGGGAFDHHQPGGGGVRKNGIPYSSAGLIWRKFGQQLVNESVKRSVDKDLIQAIDAMDNGWKPNLTTYGKTEKVAYPQLNSLIFSFNPTWKNEKDMNEAFMQAVWFAKMILENTICNIQARMEAVDAVNECINDNVSGDHRILIFPQYYPWQPQVAAQKDICFVLYPSIRGGWCVAAVAAALRSSQFRCPIPATWRGCSEKELYEKTGIEGVTFVHNAGFISSVRTKEGAVAFAKACLKNYFHQ